MTVVQKLDLDYELLFHLINPDSIKALREQEFSPELIQDPAIKTIYDWQMNHLRKRGDLASRPVLEDEWKIELREPSTAIGDLIERVRLRYIRSKTKSSLRSLLKEAQEDPASLGPLLINTGKEVSDLTVERGQAISHTDWFKVKEGYDKNIITNPPTWGFDELDYHFGGIRGLTYLLARRKTFKSWMVTNAFYQNILRGKKPMFYSLEMPAVETAARLASLASNVPYWKWERGKLLDAESHSMQEEFEGLGFCEFYIEKPKRGARSVRELLEKALDRKCGVVIIDQLQYVELVNGRSCGSLNDTGSYWDICEELRDYSDSIPILCVHQLNRSTLNNQKTNEKPDASQAKGSAAVEETASLQLGLWQNKDMKPREEFEIYSMVARSSVEGAWRIGYSLTNGCKFDWRGVVDDLGME